MGAQATNVSDSTYLAMRQQTLDLQSRASWAYACYSVTELRRAAWFLYNGRSNSTGQRGCGFG